MESILTGTRVPSGSKNDGVANPSPTLEGLKATSYESLKWTANLATELSSSELIDLIESEREFREGQGRFFKNSKNAIAWLEKEDDE